MKGTTSTGSSKFDDWEFCKNHGQCKSNCCHNKWSDDNKLKCHHHSACSTSSSGMNKIVLLKFQIASSSNHKQKTSSVRKLGEWDFCSKHSQCKSNCCHNIWSDDNRLKCHDISACRHKVKRDNVMPNEKVSKEVIQEVISKVDPVIITQYWNGLLDKSTKKPITLSEYGKYLNSFVALNLYYILFYKP